MYMYKRACCVYAYNLTYNFTSGPLEQAAILCGPTQSRDTFLTGTAMYELFFNSMCFFFCFRFRNIVFVFEKVVGEKSLTGMLV